MRQEVQQAINNINREYEGYRIRERIELMDRAGLVRTVYVNGECRLEYPQLTEEEFVALEQAQRRLDSIAPERPGEAPEVDFEKYRSGKGLVVTFTVFAVLIFIASFILGIVLGNKVVVTGSYYRSARTEFDFGTAMIFWGIGFISGSTMLGFANILDNLNRQTALLRTILWKKK